ncbi:MAG: Mobile element protein [uncultured Acetobacteraceae bacterium]|uniref:Mobile element protein n=1 Tax=uncultured Acetobacteraceae bacterium TaxID=169975 RepID=A0A6J4H8C0_9PROT|nr:MAG: Mobile element protein [uncultured Acetobacteraceae bacterium]
MGEPVRRPDPLRPSGGNICRGRHPVNRRLYQLRSRDECFVSRLKNNRGEATRYDQTAPSFLGFVLLGCIRLWIRFVYAA